MINSAQRQLMTFVGQWERQRRFTQLAIWLPRGLAAGLGAALAVAIASRLRPWLTGQQVLWVTVGAAVLGLILAATAVWLWPRSTKANIHYFDRTFGLKERAGTAFELLSQTIRTSPQMAERQIQDTLSYAANVDARRAMPVRWQGRELTAVIVLAIVVLLASLLANPQSAALARQQALSNAVSKQVQQLQAIKSVVNQNPALSDAQKTELNKIADAAISQLQQPNVTQTEAVAALSQAAQAFNAQQTQLSQTQQNAAQAGAQSLSQSQTTQGAAQGLLSGNLDDAANQLQNLAQRVGSGQLTQDQLKEAANALNQAADQLASMNQAVADALKRAANAMANGNAAEAQKQLQAAAQALQNQLQQNSQTAQSQAANAAANQAANGSQQLSQLSQSSGNQTASGSQSGASGDQNQSSQSNQSGQSGQTGQAGANQPQGVQPNANSRPKGQGGSQSNPDAAQSGDNGQQSGAPGQDQNAQGSSDSGSQSSNAGQGQTQTQGQAQGAAQGAGPGQSNTTSLGSAQNTTNQLGGGGAGQGQGGAGTNDIGGIPNSNPGANSPDNKPGGGQVAPYEGVYAPSFVGGSGGQALNPTGNNDSTDGQNTTQVQGPNSTGNVTVPLSDVAAEAAGQADQAMDTDHVPGTLRGVIRQYFSDLNSPEQP